MKCGSKILIAAFGIVTSGLFVAAQGPPAGPGGPGPGQGLGQGPMWRQGIGPQGGPHRGRRGPQIGRGMGRFGARRGVGLGRLLERPDIRERLGVTAEQAAKIRTQETGFAKSRIQTQAGLRVQRMELSELMRAEKPDRAAIEKKMRAINEAQLAAKLSAMDHRLAMQNALTPEQKEKMKQWREEQRQQFMERRGGFGPRRGPMRQPGPPTPPPPAE